MRWLKKREIVIYYILYKKFRNNPFNIGEALVLLMPYFSKKVIRNIIKYFIKIGLLIKLSETEYKLIPLEEYLNDISFKYLKRRSTLRHKIQ